MDALITPPNWQKVKVKDFGIIITGSTPLTQISEYWNGTISWITPTDINDNKDIFNSERKITQKGLDTIRMIPKNSVLVTCIASIGKNAILRVNGACNQQINAIIPNKDFNADFIYYLMENNKQYLLGKAGVTATYIISKQVFEEIDFFVPKDLDEQIAIANILSDVDRYLYSLDALILKKESVKKALSFELLSQRKRLKGFNQVWQRVRLGDIAEIKRGASPRPIENPKWFCANSNVGWVRISDISKNSRFLYKTAQKLSKKGIEKSRFVKQNSLIMSMCATIGKPIITKIDTCIHDGFVVFENPKIDLNYLYYFLCYIEKEWLESGQQGSQVNLNVDLIKNKEVFCPKDFNEQIAIANILSGLDSEIISLKNKKRQFENIKKALNHDLMSAKIRVLKK
ncbi:restriction endonuclease subunit S [Helicobacter pylori]